MINKICIRNFQCHADTTLEFSDGFNIITGSSDNGKSAVVRALNWVINNRPTGFSFQKEGCSGNTSVELTLKEGTVTRTRGSKDNFYKLNDKKFQALKGEVPPEISNILAIPEENIQNQFDPHFMLQMSPGEVARVINEKAPGLKDIDPVLSEANKYVLELSRSIKELDTRILNKEEDIKNLAWTADASKSLKVVKKLHKELLELREDTEYLQQIVSDYEEKSELVKKTGYSKNLEEALRSLKESFNVLTRKKLYLKRLRHISESTAKCQIKIDSLNKAERLSEDVLSIRKKHDELNKLIKTLRKLENTRISYTELYQKKENREDLIKQISAELKKERKNVKVCPTCKRPL